MSKTLKITVIVIGSIIAGSILLLAGLLIGRSSWDRVAVWPGNMMSGYFPQEYASDKPGAERILYRTSYGVGPGMMENYYNPDDFTQDTPDGDPYGYPYGMGLGMMSGSMMRGYGSGMMSGFGNSGISNVEPLTVEQAREAVEGYLSGLNNADLEVGEVMIFDNHAYAQIVEKSSGIGATEVLVDPATMSVYPEHGPNMMWNLKYGMMSGWGDFDPGMMGMMGGYGFRSQGNNITPEVSADMPVSPEQAVESAQRYLDEYLPGLEADEHADPFYGYYTLHVLQDGEVAGMLSVNGYTGQVFLHTWHGDFVEMSAE